MLHAAGGVAAVADGIRRSTVDEAFSRMSCVISAIWWKDWTLMKFSKEIHTQESGFFGKSQRKGAPSFQEGRDGNLGICRAHVEFEVALSGLA